MATFSAFAGYIFGTFRDTLNDPEWLFYVKFCFRACKLFCVCFENRRVKTNTDTPTLSAANT